jgi:Cys-tRNA(Pro)/Cys-tRNA(Cys) deacylase
VIPAIAGARVHELVAATAAEAAASLGVAPQRLLKTLVVKAGRRRVLVVLPITRQLDTARLAAILGTERVALASRSEAERATGCRIGAISPLACHRELEVLLDESALAFPTVFVSAGRPGREMELPPSALRDACKARVIALDGHGPA